MKVGIGLRPACLSAYNTNFYYPGTRVVKKFKIMKKNYKKYLHLTLLLFFFIPSISFASEILFNAKSDTFDQGEEFLVEVFLNTKGESVNAVEGKISYPADLLEVKDIQDGNSSLNFWIERSKAAQGKIVYSGLTPGGINGEKKLLMKIVFEGKKSGTAKIASMETTVLLNDGNGTKIKNAEGSFIIFLSSKISDQKIIETELLNDTTPPESFVPSIGNDPDIFGGKYFLVFATQDKQSGIRGFEVKEGFWGDFTEAESPYLLKDQSLKKTFYVKAIDKNKNERIERLVAKTETSIYQILIFAGIIVMLLIIFSKRIRYYFLKKNA